MCMCVYVCECVGGWRGGGGGVYHSLKQRNKWPSSLPEFKVLTARGSANQTSEHFM